MAISRIIGISLLVIINAGFFYFNSWYAIFSYGIIAATVGEERSLEIDSELTIKIITQLIYLTTLLFVLNFVILKKMVLNKKPLIYSCAISIFAVCVFLPFFLNARQKFLENNKDFTAQRSFSMELHDGDIIFQTSLSAQSKAIQLATKSKYSHVGIIYKKENEWYVYEAVQPVKKTPFSKWVARGEDSHYVIKRLKNSEQVLTPSTLTKMQQAGEKYKGKDYDIYFGWSDDKIYCSELVWKIYKEATGIEVGKLQKLSEFDLSNPIVQKKMKERYGNNIPENETVISPAAIFDSEELETIIEE